MMDGITLTADILVAVEAWRTVDVLVSTLREAEKRFRRACDQVQHIDRKLQALENRYSRARDERRRPFRYILRMRLMTTEKVRDMYHWYARAKADEVMALRRQLGEQWEDHEDDVTAFVEENDSDVEDEDDDGEADMSIDVEYVQIQQVH